MIVGAIELDFYQFACVNFDKIIFLRVIFTAFVTFKQTPFFLQAKIEIATLSQE